MNNSQITEFPEDDDNEINIYNQNSQISNTARVTKTTSNDLKKKSPAELIQIISSVSNANKRLKQEKIEAEKIVASVQSLTAEIAQEFNKFKSEIIKDINEIKEITVKIRETIQLTTNEGTKRRSKNTEIKGEEYEKLLKTLQRVDDSTLWYNPESKQIYKKKEDSLVNTYKVLCCNFPACTKQALSNGKVCYNCVDGLLQNKT